MSKQSNGQTYYKVLDANGGGKDNGMEPSISWGYDNPSAITFTFGNVPTISLTEDLSICSITPYAICSHPSMNSCSCGLFIDSIGNETVAIGNWERIGCEEDDRHVPDDFNTFTGITIFSDVVSSSVDFHAPAFYQDSDKRLKDNIEPIDAEKAQEVISQVNPVTFTWKKDGSKSQGVIAQELEDVLPEAVKDGEYKSVDYTALIPYMIKTIQAQQEEIAELKDRLSKLENR